MFSKKNTALAAACLILLAFGAQAASASNRCDTTLINSLGEPIVSVKILYDTPYGEQRPTSSQVVLPPGNEYRLGIQGVTLPTRIILFLPLAAYEFNDLSGLEPESAMRLEVAYEDGVPLLKREGGEKSVSGSAHKYLTPENRPYAVDRDFLSDATTMDEVRELVAETAAGAEPAKMELDGILFTETFGERTTLYFPLFWTSDYAGYAAVAPADSDDPDAGIAVTANMPLPGENVPGMLDDLMSDLRVDGYRPAMFRLETTSGGEDKTVNFLEGDADKYDDQDVVQEHLAAALENDALREAQIIWIKEEAFEKAKTEKESPEGPGVKVLIGNGQFKALFLP